MSTHDGHDDAEGTGDGAIEEILGGPGGAGGADLNGLLGGLGSAGGGGFADLLGGVQEAMAASQAAASQEVEGTAGGGMVRIVVTGAGDVRSVTIDPRVVDPDDVEGLEDLVMAAVRDVNGKVTALHAQAMGGLDPSAMLGGLFGGPDDEFDDDEYDDESE